MTERAIWRNGLSGNCAIGRAGTFLEGAGSDTMLLATCVWRGHEFVSAGPSPLPLASLELPDDCRRVVSRRSWTGQTVTYRWPGGGVSLELRCTLPGALFRPRGKVLRLRWAFGNAPGKAVVQGTGREFPCIGEFRPGAGRLLLCDSGRMPTLLVFSAPVERISVVSCEHWEITFRREGGALLWIPLLKPGEGKVSPAAARDLVSLAAAPPLDCKESYRVVGRRLFLRQHFPGACLSPLPTLALLAGNARGLQRLPPARKLLSTLLGPYAVAAGGTWENAVDLRFRDAEMAATRPVRGRLPAPPEELAYAGDPSWEPGTPMDQLLALRVWAPLAAFMPGKLWEGLRSRLAPPAPEAFRRSLTRLADPATGRAWAKDAAIFGARGVVSYDSDWYNGLTLAGLLAAVRCADPAIADPARHLARAVRRERRLLTEYFALYHDWALGSAWTDPRKEIWDVDCVHNGLEGLLAEAELREGEGDRAGRDRMLYLAGKTAVAVLAAKELGYACRESGFVMTPSAARHIHLRTLREWRGAWLCGPEDKFFNGSLPGGFPALSLLFARHGDLGRFRAAFREAERRHPERYRDWARFYLGRPAAAYRGRRLTSERQEDRLQAAIFYHAAPEVAMRLWTLGEDPDRVERLFGVPLPLAELLLCRAGVKVVPRARPAPGR